MTTTEEVKGWLENTPSMKNGNSLASMVWLLAYAVIALAEEIRDKKI